MCCNVTWSTLANQINTFDFFSHLCKFAESKTLSATGTYETFQLARKHASVLRVGVQEIRFAINFSRA